MSFLRLAASMVTDAALTVGTMGGWLIMADDANGGTFTSKELDYQRRLESEKEAVKILKLLLEEEKKKN